MSKNKIPSKFLKKRNNVDSGLADRLVRSMGMPNTPAVRKIVADSMRCGSDEETEDIGNKNSGNWGHKGRPGQVGGSGGGGGSGSGGGGTSGGSHGSGTKKHDWHNMSSSKYSKTKLETFPKQASPAARAVYEKAVKSEPAITNKMKSLASQMGAEMDGLDYRLKDGDSFMRKVRSDAKEKRWNQQKAADNLFDAVRYTQISDDANLASNAKKTIAQLKAEGYNVIGVKNTWKDPTNAYNGINVKVKSPDGQQFELQFHTRDSLRVKEEIHGLYEKQRVLKKNSPEWLDLDRQMKEISSRQRRPVDVESV